MRKIWPAVGGKTKWVLGAPPSGFEDAKALRNKLLRALASRAVPGTEPGEKDKAETELAKTKSDLKVTDF